MEEVKNVHTILVRKSQGKRSLNGPTHCKDLIIKWPLLVLCTFFKIMLLAG